MSVQRLDIPGLFCGILQWNIEYNGVYPDMAEREVLRCRGLLHKEWSFTVPKHRIAATPSDVDVLPKPGCQRRVDVVIEAASGPLLVCLARRVGVGRRAIEEHV